MKKQVKHSGWTKQDILKERFGKPNLLSFAETVLKAEDQSEEAFLGAQAVLLLQGLI